MRHDSVETTQGLLLLLTLLRLPQLGQLVVQAQDLAQVVEEGFFVPRMIVEAPRMQIQAVALSAANITGHTACCRRNLPRLETPFAAGSRAPCDEGIRSIWISQQ